MTEVLLIALVSLNVGVVIYWAIDRLNERDQRRRGRRSRPVRIKYIPHLEEADDGRAAERMDATASLLEHLSNDRRGIIRLRRRVGPDLPRVHEVGEQS